VVPTIAGVDGAGDRWVIAVLRCDAVSWAVAQHAAAVLQEVAGCAAVGVDVPIGLPEQGLRRCDLEARRRLGRAAASIFPAPIRAVLDAASHREACAALRQRGEAGMTIYTWGIVPKIRQWDELPLPSHIVEVHPELSFRAMAPGIVFTRKKSAPGAWQRITALSSMVDIDAALAAAPEQVALDDALDALAAAWSARRWAAGRAETLGGELDCHDRLMRIVV
jgi:predicted RNase H-like nuclease